MRAIPLAALACAALVAGCSNPCEELGERLCDCRDAGTTKASCVQDVKRQVERLAPGTDAKDACNKALDECHEPASVGFCDWLEGRCGKAACGISGEEIRDLQAEPVDPACTPTETTACEMVCS